jgi:uncharacterized RmlC-like cupin family protein
MKRDNMPVSTHDGVLVVKPGTTYIGKQGFTYGAGASAETVGARQVCMNVLPMRPAARAKAHYHKGIATIAYLEGECIVYYEDCSKAYWCNKATSVSSPQTYRTHHATKAASPAPGS